MYFLRNRKAEFQMTVARADRIGEKKILTQTDIDEMLMQNNNSFSEIYFESVIFQNVIFSGTIFYGVYFCNCDFKECEFQNVNFEKTSFTRVRFYRNAFKNVKMFQTTFYYCDLPFSFFFESTFFDVYFNFSSIVNALFEKVNIENFFTNCCDFELTTFINSEISKYTFFNTNMVKCRARTTQIIFPSYVPSHGSFIAWKKALIEDGSEVIVKLRVPEDAIRYSTRHKCRANKVEVLGYETLDGEKLPETTKVHSNYNFNFYYKIGVIEAENFDLDPRVECSSGIHFFLSRQDAVNYQF